MKCTGYNTGENLIFQKCPVQNQVGCPDCGLFAIAFAVSICLGMNPSKFIYDQEKTRRNLTECLENKIFGNFPLSVNTNWKKEDGNKNERACRLTYMYHTNY